MAKKPAVDDPTEDLANICVDCGRSITGEAKACPNCGGAMCQACFGVAPICIACEDDEYDDDDDDDDLGDDDLDDSDDDEDDDDGP